MDKNILCVENVSKKFYPALRLREIVSFHFKKENPVQALDNICFSLPIGKILGILGPNGAGKTTLLKIISTLILPDKGKVWVDKYSVGKDDEKIKSIIGLADSEERSFYWRLTGMQNLEFFASMHGLDKVKAKTKIRELFKLFNIDYEEKRFDTYSTGMKRNFSLMRAVLGNPRLILLDEPTKSLDYNSSLNLRNIIKNFSQEGKSIIIATHDIPQAEQLCDIFAIFDKSRVQAFGSLAQLRKIFGQDELPLEQIYLKTITHDR
ncbi:MAG: ABC transporter ATP-binding protein [Candidatus Omnitrophica bacterium]|nr:ABC transporter ATP-binding protein [Candidatus Omnitrophota bacterium]